MRFAEPVVRARVVGRPGPHLLAHRGIFRSVCGGVAKVLGPPTQNRLRRDVGLTDDTVTGIHESQVLATVPRHDRVPRRRSFLDAAGLSTGAERKTAWSSARASGSQDG